MALDTDRLGLPYPELSDIPDIPADVQALAEALDVANVYGQGTFANRPTSSGGSPGIPGRFYYATDTSTLYWDHGSGWTAIGPSVIADLAVTTAKLANLGVTEGKIADLAVTLAKLAANSVDTSKIVDFAVTAAKIADALKPSQGAGASTEALRALGTLVGQALPGDHASVTDRRHPLIPIVDVLPGSPTDGLEVYLRPDPTTNPQIKWHMRYNSGSASPYKWEFLGGTRWDHYVEDTVNFTGSTVWNLGLAPTLGVVIATAGVYDVWFSAQTDTDTAGEFTYAKARASVGESTTNVSEAAINATGRLITVTGRRRVTVLSPADSIGLYHLEPGPNNGQWRQKKMSIVPVQLAAA